MKFLSDILAKAGLTVDGVVTLNNTATGQTPAANDNSTKLATTAWVRGFVTPYSLPIASGTVLGGIKIGSGLAIDGTGIVSVAASGVGAIRALQQLTATAGQTVFTVSGGYTPGLIDVFLNGVLLTPTAITASNGNTFTLADGTISGDLLDVFVYNPIYNGFISSTDQVPEGLTNLYFTTARARASITLTTTGVSGAASYNSTTGVLNIPNYQGLVPTGGAVGDILAKASGTNYDTVWIPNYTSQVQHQVKLGAAMSVGTPVYVSGSTGNAGTNMIVSKASNAAEGTSSKTLGLIASGGNTNDIVFVVTEGLLAGLDTSTANAGDPVWLGVNGTLIYGLLNKPVAPAHLVFIGVVTRAQQNNGEIFVKVQNGFELDELHDLSVKNASDGDMIKYVASTGLWTKIAATTTNITEGTNLYYTDGRVNTYLTANNYATQSYVSTAISNLVNAAPSTLDTLNELAAALGNDPNFATTIATSIGTKVPQARTITINGTSYDLSADRTWTIASGVTSFNTRTGAITPASGDYTTAQVTESGNLYFTTSRARTSISLTTTGTSGAATYDSATGILNIPQYQGGVTSFNTRTGAITLSSSDVTTALTYTPVTNARTITINGTSYDLSADRSWSIASGVTSFNTRTGAITLTSGDVTTALGYTPAETVNPSARTVQAFTATASQTIFTVTGGYVPGLVDVFINGIKLAAADYTATNGSTVVLGTGTGVGNIVEIVKYTSALTASNALRTVTKFTATAGQTVFTTSYNPGLVDIFYNGSKLDSSEYTATNGTSITLTIAASLNDVIEIIAYSYAVGAFTGQAQLNGTGFVKVSGTTVTYDNSTYALDSAVVKLAGSQTITGDKVFQGTQRIDNDLLLKNLTGSPTTASGYTSLRGISGVESGTAYKGIMIIDSSMWGAALRFNTDNGYTYSFPATSGTIALTSNLSSYLPLTGGTLTGSLTGTSATFKGIGVFNNSGSGDANSGIRIVAPISTTHYNWMIGAQQNINAGFEITPSTTVGGTTFSTPVLSILNTGAATFLSSITATSFQSTTFTGSFYPYNTVFGSGADASYTQLYAGSTSGYATGIYIQGGGASSPNTITLKTASTTALTIAANQAATFSGSISATSGSFNGSVRAVNLYNIYKSDNTTLGGQLAYDSSINQLYLWNNISGGYFSIYTNSAERFKIESNGIITANNAFYAKDNIRVYGAHQFWFNNAFRGQVVNYGAYSGGTDWSPFFTSETSLSFGVDGNTTKALSIASGGAVLVNHSSVWNGEKFGVQISNNAGWSSIPSIMRLTNYISGGITKITFTDSSIIDGWIGMVPVGGNSYFAMGFSGYVEQGFRLYQNGSSIFGGTILPSSDASYNLGSTSFRWANVYTTDLHLSNKGKQNDVDGTWGDWTLQEGETEIFMLNNRSGKKFKIKLEEII